MTDPELQLCRREEYGRGLFWASHTREEMSRPGDKGSEGGRYPNKCCQQRPGESGDSSSWKAPREASEAHRMFKVE